MNLNKCQRIITIREYLYIHILALLPSPSPFPSNPNLTLVFQVEASVKKNSRNKIKSICAIGFNFRLIFSLPLRLLKNVEHLELLQQNAAHENAKANVCSGLTIRLVNAKFSPFFGLNMFTSAGD